MALTSNVNFLSPTNFKMSIDNEMFANTSFFLSSFTHPAASVEVATGFSSPRAMIPTVGDKIVYSDLQANVLLDEDMNSYTEMYNWLLRSVNENHNITTNNRAHTYTDVTLHVLSSKNNTTQTIKYYDCILTQLGNINFEVVSTEAYLTFPVTFRYSHFELL